MALNLSIKDYKMIYQKYKMQLRQKHKIEMKLIKMYLYFLNIIFIFLYYQVMKSITDELVRVSNSIASEKRTRDESE